MGISFESYFPQGAEFQLLYKQLQERSWVHASLITGEQGFGKKTLAYLIAETLLCTGNGERPCGRCKSCMMSHPHDNPDLITIQKGTPLAYDGKKDRNTIPIDDIREMIRLCGQHTVDGNAHVVIIQDAEKMTVQAQNCLLKTLEEPPENTYIILVTEHSEILLPTIISRCRIIRVKPWSEENILRVLSARGGKDPKRIKEAAALANGSIGEAIRYVDDEEYWKQRSDIILQFFQNRNRSDILRISTQWKEKKNDAENLFTVLESVIRVMMQNRFVPEKPTDVSFLPDVWQQFSRNAPKDRFEYLMSSIRNARKQVQNSVNFQAVVEKILFTLIGEIN